MNFSENLKKIRKEKNLSQEQIAEQLGVSRQSVSKWESNQAYPEMDKMLQLCQMFNLNIDDLLNQDIKEVNTSKQAKNNVNKFIDDFFDYITKTVDMFSSMKFKQKIKCLFEQVVIISFIALVLLILGAIASSVLRGIFSFIPSSVYYPIYHAFSAIYLVFCLILGAILVFHIFKVRYLDYYVIVKDKVNSNSIRENELGDVQDTNESEPETKNKTKIVLEKKEKIVIRDPEYSGYKFMSSLLKCLLLIVKLVAGFIALCFCLTFITLFICLVISFMFVKTGIIFIGVLLAITASMIINFIILNILYNFVISKKLKKAKLSIGLIIAMVLLGLGIGLGMIGVTKFDIINDITHLIILKL